MLKTIQRHLLAILFAAIAIVAIYFMVIISIKLSYSIAYKFVTKPILFAEFGRTLGIYAEFIFPYILIFINLMLVLVRNKKINRIAVILVYLIFNSWYWMGALSYWPYRVIPALCIFTGFYLLDVLIVRFIVKRLLQRIAV